MTSATIAIAGGGIGGLTAAVALKQAGFRVRVLERATALRPIGAGITLQINAMLALGRLGLAGRVADRGQPVEGVESRHADGRTRVRVGLTRIARELGAPCVSIHRADLQATLLEALGEEAVSFGAGVKGFETVPRGGVKVRTTPGDEVVADALIGADGVHSAVAEELALSGELSADYTCWRGVATLPTAEGEDRSWGAGWWGDGLAFGLFPLTGDRIYWYATQRTPSVIPREACLAKNYLLDRFTGWHGAILRMIDATPCEAIFATPIYERPFCARWGKGPVTLLGDAAHPMTPSMGQGGGMAIEDAVVLARCLARCSELPLGLRSYEAARKQRTAAMVRVSRRMTAIAHAEGPLAVAARMAIPFAPEWFRNHQLRRLYRFS